MADLVVVWGFGVKVGLEHETYECEAWSGQMLMHERSSG